jgi:hypothetical protein
MKRARNRRAAPAPKAPAGRVTMAEVDALNGQRMIAEGIRLAVIGAHDTCFESAPLEQLLEQHIDGLRAISSSLLLLVHEGKSS